MLELPYRFQSKHDFQLRIPGLRHPYFTFIPIDGKAKINDKTN